MKSPTKLLGWVTVAIVLYSGVMATPAVAQEASVPLAGVAIAGLFVVNGGVAIANGIEIIAGTADRRNGKFGVVTGLLTAGVGGLLYARSDSGYERGLAAVVLGTGLMSAGIGGIAIKASERTVRVSASPLDPQGAAGATLQLSVRF